MVVDGSWKNSGFSAEVISSVTEAITPDTLLMKPLRITLANSSAPTSIKLEEIYYPSVSQIVSSIKESI